MSRLKVVKGLKYRLADPDWDALESNAKKSGDSALIQVAESIKMRCLENHSLEGIESIDEGNGLAFCSQKNENKSYYREDYATKYVSESKRTKVGAVFDGHGHPAGYGLYAAVIGAQMLQLYCKTLNFDSWNDDETIKAQLIETFEYLNNQINNILTTLFHGEVDEHGILSNSENNAILGGTTCTIVISHITQQNKPKMITAYVGDSDAYGFGHDRVTKLTVYEHDVANPEEIKTLLPDAVLSSRPGYLSSKIETQYNYTMNSGINATGAPLKVKIKNSPPSIQMTRSLGNSVIPHRTDPTIVIDNELYSVLIASDGFWDIKDNLFFLKLIFGDKDIPTLKEESQKNFIKKMNVNFNPFDILESFKPDMQTVFKTVQYYDDVTCCVMTDVPNGLAVNTNQVVFYTSEQLLQFRLASIAQAAGLDPRGAAVPGGYRARLLSKKHRKTKFISKRYKRKHNKTRTKSRY